VRVHVYAREPICRIPEDFMGLGYEISSVAAGPLTGSNRNYINLVKRLSEHGVIRIGGNTSDFSSFAETAKPVSKPKGTVINRKNLKDLGAFLNDVGWSLIWGLNLGGRDPENAVLEAKAVSASVGDKLFAFEIGNEPDLFGGGTAHRSKTYSYADYLLEYRTFKKKLRAVLPDAPLAGPDAATKTDWVTRFAEDEGKDLRLLTHHYYRECASETSTLDHLLHVDPKLAPMLDSLQKASQEAHLPYRICETNSFCGGGKRGVSDVFGAALWTLDYLWTLATARSAGVNIETGINQLDWISWYSPIGDNNGKYSVKPGYYGMLAFDQGCLRDCLRTQCSSNGLNVTAYAASDDQKVCITILNKDDISEAEVSVTCDRQLARGRLVRLTGASLADTQNITLGGAQVTVDGQWQPRAPELIARRGAVWRLRVPAASAAILTLNSA
jgi:hypothetical protein